MLQPHSIVDGDLPAVPVVGPGGVVAVPELALDNRQVEAVRALAQWAREEKLPIAADEELVKFAHSCDYDLAAAKKCAKGFYAIRKQTPELFTDWDTGLANIKSIFDVIMVAVMPRRTPDNYRVIVNSLQTADTARYVFVDVVRALLMTMETIFLTEPTVDGVVMVHDMGKASFGHFLKFGWSLPKKMAAYTQEALPLKQRTTHLVKCSGFVDKGLKLLSHIGNKDSWERLHVHRGDDFSDLHKFVPRDCLPSNLGGTLPDLHELHERTVQRLAEFKDVFRSQLHY